MTIRIIEAFAQFLDGEGNPLVQGLLKFTESGTNATDKDTFADPDLLIPNSNPVELDSEGRSPNIYGTGSYRITLYTSDGVQIDQFDPVGGVTGETSIADWNTLTTYSAGAIVSTEGKYAISRVSGNQGHIPSSSPTQWEMVDYNRFYNPVVTYNTGARVVDIDTGIVYISLIDGNIGNTPSTSPSEWNDSIDSISSDLTALETRVSDNEDDILIIESDIVDIESDITDLGVDISDVDSKYDPQNTEKLLINDTGATPGDAYLGNNYQGEVNILPNGIGDRNYSEATAGDVSFCKDATGAVEIGSTLGSASTKKFISGAKEATFEQVIDAGLTVNAVLHIQDQKTSGTIGGTFTTGAWQTRTLNTVLTNSITGASLSSNQITLPAGTYYIEASAPGYQVDQHRARLQNITDATTEIEGTSESSEATSSQTRSFIKAEITIADSKVFEIQHYCQTSKAGTGFGRDSQFGIEVYTDIFIKKIA